MACRKTQLQFLAPNIVLGTWKRNTKWPKSFTRVIYVGDPDGVPGSWLGTRLPPAVRATWGVSQWRTLPILVSPPFKSTLSFERTNETLVTKRDSTSAIIMEGKSPIRYKSNCEQFLESNKENSFNSFNVYEVWSRSTFFKFKTGNLSLHSRKPIWGDRKIATV